MEGRRNVQSVPRLILDVSEKGTAVPPGGKNVLVEASLLRSDEKRRSIDSTSASNQSISQALVIGTYDVTMATLFWKMIMF